ncbi:MAG: hypothetical protein QNJ98_19330 [Planctomycetota bacterium]|nr:hypothetical protein [Planctomycetota bacterium]
MRNVSLALVMGMGLLVGACGGDAHVGSAAASSAIALEGAAWDGGTGIDPTAKSDKVRVIQFFVPG